MSEIKRRADEIRRLAKGCENAHDLMVKLGWPMPSVLAAIEELDLGLPVLRPDRKGKRREAQAVPKPAAKK